MDTKYTIKDIANLAGVSKGTVDRVLHQRGRVSHKSQEKVEKILKEIDYQPNPIARSLKNNKIYKISVLLPDPKHDPYWIPADQGISDAFKEFKPFGIAVNKFYYNPTDPISFLENSQVALNDTPDALLMAPLFQKEALQIFNNCETNNILIALFNNYIESFSTENFIGLDLYQSGRVAAGLIDKMISEKSNIAILHLDEEVHGKFKEKGFKDYFKEKENTPNIEVFSQNALDKVFLKKQICRFLITNPDISALFITNSKAYLIIEAIEELNKDITIVGYDLLSENIEYLRKGTIDFLIHQKPKRQAYLGVGQLAEHFLFGKAAPTKKLLPIDIITPENVMYYLD